MKDEMRVDSKERCAGLVSSKRRKPHPKTGNDWNPLRRCPYLATRAQMFHGDGEIYTGWGDDVIAHPRVALCEKHAEATFGKRKESR